MRMIVSFVFFILYSFISFADDLSNVEKYLNSISNFSADFIQMSYDGRKEHGKFYLSRPGRFKWDYMPGSKVQIVADGKNLIYFDKELNEASYFKMEKNLSSFVAREKINFHDNDIKILDQKKIGNVFLIKITSNDEKENSQVEFVFNTKPMELLGFNFINDNDQITKVKLLNQQKENTFPVGTFKIDREFLKNRRSN